jgi:DNA polymerase-3 subunit delta
MKFSQSQFDTWLVEKASLKPSFSLIYGPNRGLVQDRVNQLIQTWLGNDASSFGSVVDFSASTLLGSDFLNDGHLFSNKYALRISDATDAILPILKQYLPLRKNCSWIIMASSLSAHSILKRWFETSSEAISLACYVDEIDKVVEIIISMLNQQRKTISQEVARKWATAMACDRQSIYAEIQKMLLYCQDRSFVMEDDVHHMHRHNQKTDIESWCVKLGAIPFEQSLQSYYDLEEEGLSFISLLHGLHHHWNRLWKIQKFIQTMSFDMAVQTFKPPIFFKHIPYIKKQISKFTLQNIQDNWLAGFEMECAIKQGTRPCFDLVFLRQLF